MNASPRLSNGLLAVTSTRNTSRPPASGARRRSLRRWSGGIGITVGSRAVGRGDDQLRRHLLRVRHDGGEHGRLVVADAGNRNVQQRVEQLALALLELAGDHDADLRIGDAHPGPLEPLGQVPALVELRDLAGVVDQLEDDLHLARVTGLRHGAPTVDAPTGGDRRTIPASCAMRLCVSVRTGRRRCPTGWCVELSSWLASTLPLDVIDLGDVAADRGRPSGRPRCRRPPERATRRVDVVDVVARRLVVAVGVGGLRRGDDHPAAGTAVPHRHRRRHRCRCR